MKMPSNSSLNSLDNLSPSSSLPQEQTYINETKLNEMLDECDQTKTFAPIIRTLGLVFSSKEYVIKSFQRQAKSSVDVILDRVQQPSAIKTMKKEELRTLEGDEKDEDSMADENEAKSNDPSYTPVDLQSLRRSMIKLYDKNSQVFEVLDNALQSLATMIQLDMRVMKQKEQMEEILTVIVILFELFQIGSGPLEQSIIRTLPSVAELPMWAQVRLANIWSSHCKDGLRSILLILQQIITLQVIANNYHRDIHAVNDNDIVTNATKVMKIVYCANLLASEVLESPKFLPEERPPSPMSGIEEEDDYSSILYTFEPSKNKTFEDPLMKKLNICLYDYREPFIPFEEFQNDPLCDVIETDVDYLRYRTLLSGDGVKKFTFLTYSFILTPATKAMALFFDSRIKMYSERRTSLLNMHYLGQSANPYLKLKIRRDFLIDDTLAELEIVAMSNPKDLKKQLFIEFDGEQGIDEGGVSKEFFQLIVEQIFNPDYGMFITNDEDTQLCWFNSLSFENDAQFTLIGIVLGLAIYNNVILPVSFPMVVYRKLLNVRTSWHDLNDWNPVIYNSLKSMLDYSETDMEDVFAQTFEIGYQDVFGSPLKHCLKENGDQIMVNQSNKQEFVELYVDFLLNKSIEKQFKAFKKGFIMITDESPLNLLFRPEEIELLVCGSRNFDFDDLEKSTEYEGGYTDESEIIKHFWTIVHGLSLESKRKLLQFTTGEIKYFYFLKTM